MIAETQGWKGCTDAKCSYRKSQHLHKGNVVAFPESYSISQYPNYPNDLNAMHEAAKSLFFTQRQTYRQQLQLVMSKHFENALVVISECIDATAAQRAEAYLRALGLWEE